MVNNSTNINKTNNYLSPELTEHKKKTGHKILSYISMVAYSTNQITGIVEYTRDVVIDLLA
jgi:hypothetical protein